MVAVSVGLRVWVAVEVPLGTAVSVSVDVAVPVPVGTPVEVHVGVGTEGEVGLDFPGYPVRRAATPRTSRKDSGKLFLIYGEGPPGLLCQIKRRPFKMQSLLRQRTQILLHRAKSRKRFNSKVF